MALEILRLRNISKRNKLWVLKVVFPVSCKPAPFKYLINVTNKVEGNHEEYEKAQVQPISLSYFQIYIIKFDDTNNYHENQSEKEHFTSITHFYIYLFDTQILLKKLIIHLLLEDSEENDC